MADRIPLRIPMEQIRGTRQYKELTITESAFLEAFVSCDCDPLAAIRQAQDVSNDKAALLMAQARLKNVKIRWLIDRIYGNEDTVPTKREFLSHLWKLIIRASDKAETSKLMLLYADIQGWKRHQGKSEEGDEYADEPIPASLKDLS